LELIERWLSAHFYALSDQTLASKSTSKASGSFHGQTQMDFDSTKYGQAAQNIDTSGCLRAIGKRQFGSSKWLGSGTPYCPPPYSPPPGVSNPCPTFFPPFD
jgi:hypothetical protein